MESFCVLNQYNLHALVLNANCLRNPENSEKENFAQNKLMN